MEDISKWWNTPNALYLERRKKKYQSLGISIPIKYGDFKKNKPKPNCPNKAYIQKIIFDKQAELQQRMLEFNSEQKEYTTTPLLHDEHTKFELKTVEQFYREPIEQYKADDKCGKRAIIFIPTVKNEVRKFLFILTSCLLI